MIKLILVGDELLEGFTNERNIFIISNFLRNNKKITIDESIVVRDRYEDIKSAINYFIEKEPKVIIITGGIGPTEDDITIASVSNALNLNLVKSEIHTNIEKYKYTIEGFELVENPRGKAPAHLGYYENILIVILPGVPYEVEGFLLETKVGNTILEKLEDKVEFLVVKTNGIYETELREKLLMYYGILGNFAYLPRNDGVYLKFKGDIEKLNSIKEFLDGILKDYIWGYNGDKIEELLAKELKFKNYTISVAESFTGGKVSQILTSVPGASKYLKGS
ncbi:MAG: molybdopterin-binding protein, partial [candidate division WOR-3 bacterium]|nr:molybdopterin-binding protein [candidate division WOR-3 bacterium]MDW8150198.1 molybdopterin-binding protein [candidate division WOR-3 bacterium]